MLIRVDVYPNDSGTISSTLYASLATTRRDGSNDKDDEKNKGCLIDVGRKVGDVTFASDKTVSRQHCTLRLIGTAAAAAAAADSEVDDPRSSSLLPAPRTAEEIQACQDNPLHMCIVLENFGKGCSYIAVAKEKQPVVPPLPIDVHEDDSDSETDDEAISQPPKSQRSSSNSASNTNGLVGSASQTPGQNDIPELSTATRNFCKSTAATAMAPFELIPLQAGESRVLAFPKLPSITTTTKTNVKRERTVMIQCGRFESTLAITWLDYQFALSRLSKAQLTSLTPNLPLLVGAQLVPDHLPTSTTTHLVTPQLLGGAKQLIAWCYQIPMVVPDYCQVLMDRTKPNDPFPLVQDYTSKIPPTKSSSKKSPQESFWTSVTPNPQLLASYTLLSVQADDMERLAEAAGIKVLSLYDMETEEEALEEAQDLISQGQPCISIGSLRKNTLSQKLSTIDQVHMVSAKDLAKTISEQDPSKLFRGAGEKAVVDKSQRLTLKRQNQEDNHDDDDNEARLSATVHSQVLLETHYESQAPASRSAIDAIPEVEEEEEEENEKVVSDQEKSTKPATTTFQVTTKNKNIEVKPSPTKSTSTTHGSKLLGGSNPDGWFDTAPKQEELRKDWRKRALKQEEQALGGFSFPPPAETGHVVVYGRSNDKEQEEPNSRRHQGTSYYYSSSHPHGSSSSSSRTTRNFKRFCKNVIPVRSRIRITLRAVLPQHDNDNERRQLLEDQRQELEEQQRLADDLFRGDGLQGSMKKRRRL
jgi:hypothetical protein